jgi:hypothetical protein
LLIENYFERIRTLLKNSPIIKTFELETQKRTENLGLIRGNVTFIDGSRLYVREFNAEPTKNIVETNCDRLKKR